jgi:hypothetical protein
VRKRSPIARHLDSHVRADDFDFSHLADKIGRHTNSNLVFQHYRQLVLPGQKCRSRSNRAVIRVYDAAGNVIETHEQAGQIKE